MNTIHTRIKQIRKESKETQEAFASKLDLSRNFIAQIETGSRLPSDRTIRDICNVYNVSEEWLRTGSGEPYVPRTVNQQIAEFINDAMADQDESIRKRFILAISKFTDEDWEYFDDLIKRVFPKN